MKFKFRLLKISLFVLGSGLALLAGFYARVYTATEFPHFNLSFPGRKGIPVGGVGARGREGRLVVDIAGMSTLKKLLQPGDLAISTHWLKNEDERSHRLWVELEKPPFEVSFSSLDKDFDEETGFFKRRVKPGEMVMLDFQVKIPPKLRFFKPVIYEGSLIVKDADSGRELVRFPIKILNKGSFSQRGKSCCE